MLELLDSFRIRFAGRPLLLCLALAAGAWLVIRRRRRARWISSRALERTLGVDRRPRARSPTLAIVVVYARDEHYFDAAEPTMTAVGWLFALGQPIYHGVDAAERYAHIYGPMAFIPHGLVLRAFGPSIGASKRLGAAAALAQPRRAHCSRCDRRRGAMACADADRRLRARLSDVPQLHVLDATRAAAVAVRRRRAAGAASRMRGAIGASPSASAPAVLWNLKITGPLYTLPMLVLFVWRGAPARRPRSSPSLAPRSWRRCRSRCRTCRSSAYLPWVQLSSRNGLLLSMLRQNIEWAAFLLLPLLVAVLRRRDQTTRPSDSAWRWLVAALAIGIGGVAWPPRSRRRHRITSLPFAADRRLWRRRGASTASPLCSPVAAARVLALSCAAAACLVALAQQASFLRIDARARRDRRDRATFARSCSAHPGLVVEMGYSGDDRLTFARPELVFRSGVVH